jgi:hypothetical protein
LTWRIDQVRHRHYITGGELVEQAPELRAFGLGIL